MYVTFVPFDITDGFPFSRFWFVWRRIPMFSDNTRRLLGDEGYGVMVRCTIWPIPKHQCIGAAIYQTAERETIDHGKRCKCTQPTTLRAYATPPCGVARVRSMTKMSDNI